MAENSAAKSGSAASWRSISGEKRNTGGVTSGG